MKNLYLTGGASTLPIVSTYVSSLFNGLSLQQNSSGQETATGAALWCLNKISKLEK